MDWYYTGKPEPVANDLAALPHYSSISMAASRKAGGSGPAEGDDGDEDAASASSSCPAATVALSTPVSLPMNEKSDKIIGYEASNLTSTAWVAAKAQVNADGRLRAGYIRTYIRTSSGCGTTTGSRHRPSLGSPRPWPRRARRAPSRAAIRPPLQRVQQLQLRLSWWLPLSLLRLCRRMQVMQAVRSTHASPRKRRWRRRRQRRQPRSPVNSRNSSARG